MSYLDELFGLQGRTALVTGGGSALGMEICRGLALAGARVIITSQSESKAIECANKLRQFDSDSLGMVWDVKAPDGVMNLNSALSATGVEKIHILVHMPGGVGAVIPAGGTLSMALPEDARKVMDLNFWSFDTIVRGMLNRLWAAEDASVISILSASAVNPLTRVVYYSAAKAALTNITKGLAIEFGRKASIYGAGESIIRVNGLVPGFFPTLQNEDILRQIDPLTEVSREASILAHTPLGRYGQNSELVGPAILLASKASSFITGSLLVVDGGFGAMTI